VSALSLKAILEALPEQIDVIREFQVGYDIIQAGRSYDMGLVAAYDDRAALAVYADHPAHLPVVKRASELCENVVACDFLY
jgi:hypothetical protein